MDAIDFAVLFIGGFFFGLTARLLYGNMMGNFRRPRRVARPITNVRYISPKFDDEHVAADQERKNYPSQRACGQ